MVCVIGGLEFNHVYNYTTGARRVVLTVDSYRNSTCIPEYDRTIHVPIPAGEYHQSHSLSIDRVIDRVIGQHGNTHDIIVSFPENIQEIER